MKTKTILAAAVLAALVGEYQVFAYTPIKGEQIITGEQLAEKENEYKGEGIDSSLKVKPLVLSGKSVLVLADGDTTPQGSPSKNFSNLGSFIIENGQDNALHDATGNGVIEASSGYSINFDNVQNINLGTDEELLYNGGPVLHAQSGCINITKANNLNIYCVNSAIMAQRTNASNATGSGIINVEAQNINIHSGEAAILAWIFKTPGEKDDKNPTNVSLNASNSIYIESNGEKALGPNAALEIYDSGVNGAVKTSFKATNDITLIGRENEELVNTGSPADGYGIWLHRKGSGESTFEIISEQGNVKIEGTQYGIWSVSDQNVGTASDQMNISGSVKGKIVTIRSDKGTGIYLDKTNELDLRGETIDVSGTTAVNAQNSSTLNLQGTGSSSVINLTSTVENGNAINAAGGSTVTLGDGTHATDVNINGYVNVSGTNSNLTFADNTTTHVDSKYLTGTTSFITADNADSVTFNNGAKLDIGNVAADKELNFSNNKEISKAAADNIVTDNVLQKFELDENGKLQATTVKKENAAELLGGSVLTNVALAATGDARYAAVKALVDGKNAKEALDSAGGLSGLANVAHGTYTMNGLFSDAVSGHLMNRQDQDVWAYGFHSKENVNGLSFGGDYDAQYNGVTAGVDLYKNGGTTAGVALTYGDSNVSGSNGFATTKSDADYYGASIYGRFDRGSYALLGDISYMKGDHDITQWNKNTITASQDSDSISVGVKALKDYAAGENGTLTPYVGLRYLRLSTDDFTASNGLHYVGDDQDMVIVPVGVNYTASISHGKWSVRPYAGIGYVWTAGDRSADQTVVVPGGADSFSYDTADSSSFIARVGVTTDCDDMSYGIGYSWQKGDSVSNNAWTVSASYHF